MKIRTKLIITILATAAMSFLVSIVFGYFEMRNASIKNIKNKLNIIADLQEARVANIVENNLERIISFTNRVGVIDAIEKYNQEPDNANKNELTIRIDDAKKSSPDYQSIWITNASGKVIATSKQSDDNSDFSQNQYFLTGQNDNSITFTHNQHDNNNYFYLSGPIKKDDKLLGVYIVQTNTNDIAKILNNYTGLGQTGETIIGKSNNNEIEYFLDTRFPIPSGTKLTLDNDQLPIVQALKNNENLFTNLLDYRGEKVFVTTRYIDNINWGMVVKIDQKEVFKSIYLMALILGAVLIVFSVFAYFVATIIAKSISKPIEKLQHGMEKIAAGDLDYKVGTFTKDEIGQLSREVDAIVSTTKQSRLEIDQKVKEQTEAIIISGQKLENQQKAILNVLEDVNEEKLKVTEEKNKIDAILSSIGDAVFVIDNDEKIIMFNIIAEKISGFSKEEVLGRPYKEVLKFVLEKDQTVNDRFVKEAMQKGVITYMANHTMLITKYGKQIPVADSASPLRAKNGKTLGCVVVFHDVTKERELSRMKDEFLNIAAHDLRTPMTAIKGYNDMMLNGDFGQLPDTIKIPLEETKIAAERMIRLVNDFLTSSRIERGKITIVPKEIDLIPLIKTDIGQIEPIAKKKGLKLVVGQLPEKLMVWADSDKIQQVIINLLDNAIKYTKAGSITVDIKIKDNAVIFSVTDTGQGISEEAQEKLFSKYYQVSGGKNEVIEGQGTGLGLGLYISRLIVEGCGGKIWVESRIGQGSKFSFSLSLINNSHPTQAFPMIKKLSEEKDHNANATILKRSS